MTSALLCSRLGSEFDAFLFAAVGDEGNGQSLSVISALARLELDPWQEAVSLADLPMIAATQRLTSLIGALPGGLANHFAPATIAARLAGLLPRRGAVRHATTKGKPDVDDIAKLKSGLVMAGFFFFVVLGSQWVATNKEPRAKVHSPVVESSTTVVPTVPRSH